MIAHEVKPTSHRRWFRFRLRTLLVAVTLLCVFLGAYVRQVYVQKRAVAALEAQGALVYYGKTVPWLFGFIDRDLFGAPTAVSLFQTNAGDADLLHLKELPHLKIVNIAATRVTDEGLARLADLPELERVVCERGQFSAAGFEKLRQTQFDCEFVDGPLQGWLLSTPDKMRQRVIVDSQPSE